MAIIGGTAQSASGSVNEGRRIMAEESEAKGATVSSFNADATPAQKAASVAQQAGAQLSVPVEGGESSAGRPPATDGSSPPAPIIIPTITIEDTDDEKTAVPKEKVKEEVASKVEAEAAPPVAPPLSSAPASYVIPDWYTVGWRQMSGIDKPPVPEGEEKDQSILNTFLDEQYYGAWYRDAGVIVFAVLSSHILTWLGFGWGWLFIILGLCHACYTTSVRRFERNVRDDMVREMVNARLDGSVAESVEWMNGFLERFWQIYQPILSQTILTSVDQILSISTPAFLDSLRLQDFSLGTKAPRIDKIWTFSQPEQDVVQMEWAISFTPTDEEDMTKRQRDAKVNPKIILLIRLGKGLATAALPVLVEDVTLTGRISIRMKLIPNFPYVQILDFCFMEKPVISYALKPLGGETLGLDVSNIPGLSSFIRETTHAILGPMMYHPNLYRLNLEQMMSGKPLETAIGVVQVLVHSARGVKGGDGTPDPYIALSVNEQAELGRTKWRKNTSNPTWMEVKYILVNNLKGKLVFDLYDYNEHRRNSKLSSTSFDLSLLEADSVHEGIASKLLKDDKERGELRYDVKFYPVIQEEGVEDTDSSVGIVRLVIHQAKELDSSGTLSGELNPLAKVYLSSSSTPPFCTARYKHTNIPVWEAPFEFLCSAKDSEVVTIKIIDDRDFLKDPVVGYMSVRLADLLESTAGGRDWFPLSGCKTGKIRVSARWKPVSMSGSLHGPDQYRPPIGVVRLLIDKAVDVKNVDAALGGKSDPYVRVQVRNVTKNRTEVVNNDLNPVWDQIIYIPVHSMKESLMLECMDYQTLTKDRPLGAVELHVSDLAKESEDSRFPYKSTGVKIAADPLHLDLGSTKGVLHYQASFIPAMKLDVKFSPPSAEALQAAREADDDDGGYVSDSSSDEHAAPVGLTVKPLKKKNVPAPTGSNAGTPVGTPRSSLDSVEVKKDVEAPVAPAGMSVEELLAQPSGIIVFNVISGELAKKSRLEVLLDDGYWPCFSTVKSQSTTARWEYIGEGFLKEIDFGQVWLRLNEADDGEGDDVVAEWKGEAKEFLRSTLKGAHEYTLTGNDGRYVSTIAIEARYIPVPVTLEPRESVNNQGILRIELLDAYDIRAADRGGKSDPYAVFTLNGNKVFKSETKKKTLTPEWNESFEATVPSRVAADFSVEVFDWNQIEQPKSLGTGRINVNILDAFQVSEQVIPLSTAKYGQKGYVRLRVLFKPMIIEKTRKNTSTLTGLGTRAMTQIGAAPVNAGKGVISGIAGIFK